MTPEEKIHDAIRTLMQADDRRLRDAAVTLIRAYTPVNECLRWASHQVVGGRGGIPACDLQMVASVALRGGDWGGERDRLAAKRSEQRHMRQLPRGSSSPR